MKVGFNKLVKRGDQLSLIKKINNLLDEAVRTEPSARLYLGMIMKLKYIRVVGIIDTLAGSRIVNEIS